nr:MAG TPA: hypothetical protein [Caudoviricetes sp.]DAU22360.1 MAG TPA: hypothetical protein [Caudoviricetes sp.]
MFLFILVLLYTLTSIFSRRNTSQIILVLVYCYLCNLYTCTSI